MKIVSQAHRILTPISTDGYIELQNLEHIARVCYKSEGTVDSINLGRTKEFIRRLIKNGHDAMLEHGYISVEFVTDRGVSHELVRHRMASYAQESTRYCNYSQNRFGGEIAVIMPSYIPDDPDNKGYQYWYDSCLKAENRYFVLLDDGWSPQQARAVLPTCLKTQIVVTANYREWRHILRLRCAKDAHPQMQALMKPLLEELHGKFDVLFDDIYEGAFGLKGEK